MGVIWGFGRNQKPVGGGSAPCTPKLNFLNRMLKSNTLKFDFCQKKVS